MAFEHKDNMGSLFKNDRKQNERQPDYRGEAKIDGRDYWISAWLKEGNRGKFFSFAFEDKEKGKPDSKAKADAFTGDRGQDAMDGRDDGPDLDDSIPF